MLPATLIKEVEDAGFDAEEIKEVEESSVRLLIEGMTCSACTGAVERALTEMNGVEAVSVSPCRRALLRCVSTLISLGRATSSRS